jgi:hypothetical protein
MLMHGTALDQTIRLIGLYSIILFKDCLFRFTYYKWKWEGRLPPELLQAEEEYREFTEYGHEQSAKRFRDSMPEWYTKRF